MFVGRHAAAAEADEQHSLVAELKALRALVEQRDGSAADAVQSLKHELALIRDTIARNKRELGQLIGDGNERRMARAVDELRASVDGMDYATQKILKSVEVIDDSAKALAVAQKTDYGCGLTQDIQDHVVQIYEACNFQDLSGQRIGHVIETLNMIENQVEDMLARHSGRPGDAPAAKPGHALLNGPRLDGDSGHTSQLAIDEMFA